MKFLCRGPTAKQGEMLPKYVYVQLPESYTTDNILNSYTRAKLKQEPKKEASS